MPRFTRRDWLKAASVLCGSAALGATPEAILEAREKIARYRQATALGPLKRKLPSIEACCKLAKEIGFVGFDLCAPEYWPELKKHGLICTMTPSHKLTDGLADPKFHDACLKAIRESIDLTSAAGFPNVITFSGNRRGMSDEEGLENCVKALKQVAGYAERKRVTICLEFLNSAKTHPDYMADSTKWCVELVHRVGSERVKVLYDIFHAGMMGEDVVADIENHADCWGHYHTAGVPGRHEIDDSQTLDYPKIMRTIARTGYAGIVAHEFSPTRDLAESLKQAYAICDV
ncbi:TIM barrel protein [Thermostilla marina]